MSQKALLEKLRDLSKKELKRSKAARLRDVISEVELALSKGVKRESIVKTLSENGLNISLKNFDTALYRYRKKQGKPNKAIASNSDNESPVSVPQTVEHMPSALSNDSHNPASLDAIINDTPDLTALAKQFKQSQLKGKQK